MSVVAVVASRILDGRSEAMEVAVVAAATRSLDGRLEGIEVSGPIVRWHY